MQGHTIAAARRDGASGHCKSRWCVGPFYAKECSYQALCHPRFSTSLAFPHKTHIWQATDASPFFRRQRSQSIHFRSHIFFSSSPLLSSFSTVIHCVRFFSSKCSIQFTTTLIRREYSEGTEIYCARLFRQKVLVSLYRYWFDEKMSL